MTVVAARLSLVQPVGGSISDGDSESNLSGLNSQPDQLMNGGGGGGFLSPNGATADDLPVGGATVCELVLLRLHVGRRGKTNNVVS